MNIIYIHTHDTGRFISPYGVNIETPHLMKFAKEGTLFRRAFCVGPTCSPSRSGLLTGMLPHNNGMLGLAHRGFGLKDYEQHLANYLKKNGYETALCGIQHIAKDAKDIGYDHILTKDQSDMTHYDKINVKEACNYIKDKKDKPFFLSFGMWRTHRAFPEVGEDVVNPDYVKVPFPIFDNKENRQDMANFMASAKVMDECFGQVMAAIDEADIRDNTVILFTTDHGVAFPYMKCNLQDAGIGVSLIMDYNKNNMKGKATDALVSQIDIFPTLCEILGIDKPAWLQGTSLVPVLEDKKEQVREEIYAEVSYHAAYEPKRCLRTNRYKLIRHYDKHDQVVPSNIDESPGKKLIIDHGYLEYKIDKDMLFDLYIDPAEKVNLVGNPQYEEVYRRLSKQLEEHMTNTNDPLRYGQVAKPDGAIVNTLACVNPQLDIFEEDGIR